MKPYNRLPLPCYQWYFKLISPELATRAGAYKASDQVIALKHSEYWKFFKWSSQILESWIWQFNPQANGKWRIYFFRSAELGKNYKYWKSENKMQTSEQCFALWQLLPNIVDELIVVRDFSRCIKSDHIRHIC